MQVLDIFSGIGAFSLGLERAGLRTAAFCECEPYARAVLRKHWPDVPCYDDVRTLTAAKLRADGIRPQVICGGFPCQDISRAGKKIGIAGSRSSLWAQYARLISELRPDYVIVENVADLLVRGMGEVLGDLAALRYDAEWHCIPASAIGAPHRRDRLWIIGYAAPGNDEATTADPASRLGPLGRHMARSQRIAGLDTETPWNENPEDQPDFLGVDDGTASRMDRLRCLGNAVVPQIPELIGHAIMADQLHRREKHN